METPCIEWQGRRLKSGYGVANSGKRSSTLYAHRKAYCEANGLAVDEIKGKVVRHMCDNPACVNPLHLEIGTQADNMNDMKLRGRSTKGETNPRARLTWEIVRAIRSEYVPGHPVHGGAAIARRIGVSQQTVQQALKGATWRVDG